MPYVVLEDGVRGVLFGGFCLEVRRDGKCTKNHLRSMRFKFTLNKTLNEIKIGSL